MFPSVYFLKNSYILFLFIFNVFLFYKHLWYITNGFKAYISQSIIQCLSTLYKLSLSASAKLFHKMNNYNTLYFTFFKILIGFALRLAAKIHYNQLPFNFSNTQNLNNRKRYNIVYNCGFLWQKSQCR